MTDCRLESLSKKFGRQMRSKRSMSECALIALSLYPLPPKQVSRCFIFCDGGGRNPAAWLRLEEKRERAPPCGEATSVCLKNNVRLLHSNRATWQQSLWIKVALDVHSESTAYLRNGGYGCVVSSSTIMDHVAHVYWFTWFDVQHGCMPRCSNRDRIPTVKRKEISHWCPIYVRRGERKWSGRSTQSTNGQQSHVQRHKSCIWMTPPFWHFPVEWSEPRICHSPFELFLCHFHSPYDESFKNAELEMRPDGMVACSASNMQQSARVQFQPNKGGLWSGCTADLGCHR